MDGLWNELKSVIDGYSLFVTEYKYLALVICVLIYGVFKWKQLKAQEVKNFLLYSGAMVMLLLFPVTAWVFMKYQTGFYSYFRVWSYVPLTAMLAWGIVTVIFQELPTEAMKERFSCVSTKVWRVIGVLTAVAVLFVAGNQGKMLHISENEKSMKQNGADILQYMENENLLEGRLIWGAKDILQYMRSHNGDVVLYYGRDMWDAAAGAYDYEGYSAEETACYEWMELVSLPHTLYLLEIEQATDEIHEALATEIYLKTAVENGVNTIILPGYIDPWVERKIKLIGQEQGNKITTAAVGDYTIWMLDEQ